MKREGRQHGMVRTHPSPLTPRATRTINVVDSTPTAGMFTKVNPLKPTNHSKFSGKCGKARCSDCHLQPWCKSSEKTKGSYKLKGPNDDVSRLKLVSWRVVDSRPGLGMSFAKSSASEIVAHMDEVEDEVNDAVLGEFDFHQEMELDGGDEIEIMNGADEGDVETMSFCEVGYVWEQVEGDDSWCLVAEM